MSRPEALLAALRPEEKVGLLSGADLWRTRPIRRLGIRSLVMSDGPVGVRGPLFRDGPPATCFPCGANLGATFDEDLLGRVGAALAEEARDRGVGLLLAPTVNLQRNPLAGRTFECFSEDPLVTARLAVAFVRGLQAGGVGACIKHYALNECETERHTASSEVDPRALHELYLLPFEAAVRQADVAAVMGAYNRVAGIHACEHRGLLRDVLRERWGFRGAVISDWFARAGTAAGIEAGLDLEMPGPPRARGAQLLSAAERGEVSWSAIDERVRCVLGLLARSGCLGPEPPPPAGGGESPAVRALAREAAVASLVLLRNRGLLPLEVPGLRRLAVIGPGARDTVVQGGGSAQLPPWRAVSVWEGLAERLGGAVELLFERGCGTGGHLLPLDGRYLEAAGGGDAGPLEVAFGAGGEPGAAPVFRKRARALDFVWLEPPHPDLPARDFQAVIRGRLRPPEGGRYRLGVRSVGRSRLFLDGELLVDNWSRQEPGDTFFGFGSAWSVAEVELEAGDCRELRVEFACGGAPFAAVRAGIAPPVPPDALARAEAVARAADAAVVVVGHPPGFESEGRDRRDLRLPGAQDELVRRVVAANPRTAVLVNAGAPVEMDWIEEPAAVLWLGYPGQEAGHAVTDVLLGDRDPGGRMAMSLPRRGEEHPGYANPPVREGRVVYREGVFLGYRGTPPGRAEPRVPFGFGLSTTRFAWTALTLSRRRGGLRPPLEASLEVANLGPRPGVEVVQLYRRALRPPLPTPELELVGFARVALAPSARVRVTFELGPRAFAHYDAAGGCFRAAAGPYELHAAASSRDLRSAARFELLGSEVAPGPPLAAAPRVEPAGGGDRTEEDPPS